MACIQDHLILLFNLQVHYVTSGLLATRMSFRLNEEQSIEYMVPILVFAKFKVHWYSRRGMRWSELRQTLLVLSDRWPIPQVILVYLAGNCISRRNTLDLISQIKLDILCLHTILPNTTIVFSGVIPRLTWLLCPDIKYIEKRKTC